MSLTAQNLDASSLDAPSLAAPSLERFGAAPPPPAGGPDWLAPLRAAGHSRFEALGLPTRKVESWKYTSLRALEGLRFAPPEGAPPPLEPVPSLLGSGWESHRLVLVDGRARPELSRLDKLPAGLTLRPLAAVLAEQPGLVEAHLGRIADDQGQPLLALNTALMEDGYVIHVARGVTVAAPIEILFLRSRTEGPTAAHPRCLVVLEEGATATLVEHHSDESAQTYLSNLASEIDVGRYARLRHVKVQEDSPAAFHLATSHVRVAEEATYDGFCLSLGAALSRNETAVRLEGAGAFCRLAGAYLMTGKQHCDNTTTVDHLVPDTTCREVFKGVLADESRAVFQGKLKVHRDAQRTDGHQLSKALLLSDRAEIDAKPELEIYADDVKCSHGATAGELDREALFYLRTRGLPEPRARLLLIESFLSEAIEEISDTRLRGRIQNEVSHRLHRRLDAGDTNRRLDAGDTNRRLDAGDTNRRLDAGESQ